MPEDNQKQDQVQRIYELRQEAQRLEKIRREAAETLRIWTAVNKEMKKRVEKREKKIGELKKNKNM